MTFRLDEATRDRIGETVPHSIHNGQRRCMRRRSYWCRSEWVSRKTVSHGRFRAKI